MIYEILLTSGVGGLLWLDRFQAFQVMLSRPLVAGPVIGWLAGDLKAGAAAGILYELLWLGRPPVGGYIPPDSTLATIATAAVAGIVSVQWSAPVMPTVVVSFLALFPMAHMGRRLDTRLRMSLSQPAAWAEAIQRRSPGASLAKPMLSGLGRGFLYAFATLVPAITIGTFLVAAATLALNSKAQRALEFAYYVIPVMAAADAMVYAEDREDTILFLVGFGAVLCGGLFMRLFSFGP